MSLVDSCIVQLCFSLPISLSRECVIVSCSCVCFSVQGTQLISISQLQLSNTLPHFQESSWMRPNISRDESRDLLQGRDDGTFLVRPKPGINEQQVHPTDPLHTHTIDIV